MQMVKGGDFHRGKLSFKKRPHKIIIQKLGWYSNQGKRKKQRRQFKEAIHTIGGSWTV